MTLPISLDSKRSGHVYRWTRDWRGDSPNGDPIHPDNYVGEVDGIVYGSATPQRVNGRQELASTEGMIGCTGTPLRSGDRIVVNDNVKLVVVGDPQWNFP